MARRRTGWHGSRQATSPATPTGSTPSPDVAERRLVGELDTRERGAETVMPDARSANIPLCRPGI